MRLKGLRIRNFRSVEDSEPFDVDPVTCLVGKNESGKTSILHALYRLNPHEKSESKYDIDRDYPRRHLADYEARHGKNHPDVLETTWELSDREQRELKELLGPSVPALTEVIARKGFGGDAPRWDLTVDEGALIQHCIATSELHNEEREKLANCNTIATAKAAIAALGGEATDRHRKLITVLGARFPGDSGTTAGAALLTKWLPTFLYFDSYQKMKGRIHLEQLLDRRSKNGLDAADRLFLNFCEYAGTTLDALVSIEKFEPLKARLEGASSKLTRQIFEYWKQSEFLRVQFSKDACPPKDPAPFNSGHMFSTRIWNELHECSVPFDDRSAGFVWFFSFLVLFSQVKKTHGDNLVILLDEPGLSLHGKAQRDLLRFIHDQLAPKFPVIYSTHSPFMVPTENLLCVRTVEDVILKRDGAPPEVHGTKVSADVLKVTADTLFPLQGALGYEITQGLFVGKHTLVVEGPSDLVYLRAFADSLRDEKSPSLDARWTVCPVGGIERVAAFLALFGGNDLNVVALVDLADGGKKTARELQRLTEVLKKGRVLTTAEFVGASEADVEDIVGFEAYLALVNLAYGLDGPARISAPADRSKYPRVVKYVEEHFRTHADLPEFDHYRPAEWLLLNRAQRLKALPGATEALERFGKLFAAINANIAAKT